MTIFVGRLLFVLHSYSCLFRFCLPPATTRYCDSYVDETTGDSLCPTGFSAIDDSESFPCTDGVCTADECCTEGEWVFGLFSLLVGAGV